jgi:MFS family permease
VKKHALIKDLIELRGNPRGCVYAEPLWGIPFNLYAPYASVFMVALGLADRQIGLIVSLSWAAQVLLSFLSGVITDKLGRRLATLIFDIVAWSLPALISALAQNFWWFLAAGMINSFWRITQNSWSCLLVEDAEPERLVGIYTWIYIANIMVGFVAPLAGILIGTYSLAPTIRGLYFFAAAMFAIKATVTFLFTKETAQGEVRRRETRGQSLAALLSGYGPVLRALLGSPKTLYAGAIMLVISVTQMIGGSFWAIMATEKLGIPAEKLSLFPFVRSAVVISLFFLATQALARLRFKVPMTLGFIGFAASQLLYVCAPERGYAFLFAGTVLEACSFAVANPLVDRLVVLTVDPKERARIQSLLYLGVILLSSPFGWIAGSFSQLDKAYPFILSAALYALGAALALFAGRAAERAGSAASAGD